MVPVGVCRLMSDWSPAANPATGSVVIASAPPVTYVKERRFMPEFYSVNRHRLRLCPAAPHFARLLGSKRHRNCLQTSGPVQPSGFAGLVCRANRSALILRPPLILDKALQTSARSYRSK